MRKDLTVNEYFQGIKNRDKTILARAITLIESKNSKHIEMTSELIEMILPLTGRAKRVGISGTPGVGKSTFIEHFGMHLINQGHKIAVLAVDPTSQVTGGSILGDKTRMQYLSQSQDAFIRPSPNGTTLGGVAAKTREAMLLCDAFGFDYIFIETVGVGQSEISVSKIVDFFLLLMQPGSGDDLQGIKRGILEVSDLVCVTKSDGEFEEISKVAQHDYTMSLGVLQEKRAWQTKVIRTSCVTKKGFAEVESILKDYFIKLNYKEHRSKQLEYWVKDLLVQSIEQRLKSKGLMQKEIQSLETGKKSVHAIIETLLAGVITND